MQTIVIDPQFNGFPNIALGGYVGGVLARGIASAEASFRHPVHTGKHYQKLSGQDGEALCDGSDVIALVQRADKIDIEPRSPIEIETSEIASRNYVGYERHPYPNCFVCGPSRPEGDGLRIFPGSVPGHDNVVAAAWNPSRAFADSSDRVQSEYIWSALDCPTIWPLILYGQPDSTERVVSACFAVELISPVFARESQVVMGWKVSEVGRTRVTGGAIYSCEGRLLAKVKHTLVSTDWGVPLGLNNWPQTTDFLVT